MKFLSVLRKSLKEQIRHFWILILTVSMAPFFVGIYYLMMESSRPQYDILILNQDIGIEYQGESLNYGNFINEYVETLEKDSFELPLKVSVATSKEQAISKLKNKKADALIILPEDFSEEFQRLDAGSDSSSITLELIGDLTDFNYIISAIWANEIVNHFIFEGSQKINPITIKETPLGSTGHFDDFDLVTPGLIILAVIMLMFSASVAIVTEVENKTIIRLKLSKLTALEFLSGISVVQILVGIISVVLTITVALGLGFEAKGSYWLFFLVVVLCAVSIIAFSLILAAFTKTVNEILIVGNFPLFLFMFFSGAAFPMEGKALFHIAGYPVSFQGLMSPAHAIPAVKKILMFDMGFLDVLPEIIALVTITIIYFIIGVWAFQIRHMQVE